VSLEVKRDFDPIKCTGTKDDYTWYLWVLETPDGERPIFPKEDLHRKFLALGFKQGTVFSLKRVAVMSEQSDRWITSYVISHEGKEYPLNGDSEAKTDEGRKLPPVKKEILAQENDKAFEVWCERKQKLYEWAMNTILDADLDRFGARYPEYCKDEKKRMALEMVLHERASTKINTLIMGFDRNGGVK